MDNDARENAIRILLDEQAEVEDRVVSAEHLGASSNVQAFDALLEICSAPDADKKLLRAAAESLAKIANKLGHEQKVAAANLNSAARETYSVASG